MKRISLITGLACITGLSTYAGAKTVKDKTEVTAPVMRCCVDGNSVGNGKRYNVSHKGKHYVTCSKGCAHELKKRLARSV